MEDAKLPELPQSEVVLKLSELAEKYAHAVPFLFQVVSGFLAENEKDPTIGVDQVYSVHLVKERKVVMINSAYGEYGIPVNSTAKFGLIQNEENESKTYGTVEELLSARPPPKVVAVRSKFVSADRKVSLMKNEILIVRSVLRTKLGLSKSGLVVYSTFQHKEMVLSREYGIQFTVDPHSTQLYLTDLLDNSVDFISCSARIFTVKDSLGVLRRNPVVIERFETQRSVVVSLFRNNPTSKRKQSAAFIDIPTIINIRLRIIKTGESDEAYQKIFKKSQAFLTEYDPSKIQVCVDAQTDTEYVTQAQLFAEIRKEKEKREIAESAPEHYQTLLSIRQELEKDNSDYQDLIPVKTISKEHTFREPTPDYQEVYQPTSDYQVLIEKTKDPVVSYEDVKFTHNGSKPEVIIPALPPRPPPLAPKTKPLEETSQKNMTAEHLASPKPRGTSEESTSKPEVKPKPKPFLPLPSSTVPQHNVNDTPKSKGRDYEPPPKSPVCPPPKSSSHNKPKIPPRPPANQNSQDKQELDHGNESEDRLKGLQESIDILMRQVSSLLSRQTVLESEMKALKSASRRCHDPNLVTVEVGMSSSEVLNVLEKAGLSQYQESFSREAVDGQLFMMLDHEMLADDLGVSSRLHRARILKLKE